MRANELSPVTPTLLDAYTIPAGLCSADGHWLYLNETLRRKLAKYPHASLAELLVMPEQWNLARRVMLRNRRIELIEWKLGVPLHDSYAHSTRINGLYDTPCFLIEFHSIYQRLGAFSEQTRLHRERAIHMHRSHKLNKQMSRLQSVALTDSLTSIPNRRAFEESYPGYWHTAAQSHHWFSVVLIDVDFFKGINDTYGHFMGDQVLARIAHCLSSCLRRESDFLARYGGEEFVAILPGANREVARHVAERMLEAVCSQKLLNPASAISEYVTVSIGCCTTGPSSDVADPLQFIQRADEMLYQAKAGGRNRIMHDVLESPPDETGVVFA